jgi:diadenosine tetraphosphatase ApaH/serine/threonine PP2A family protein phosphatase
MENNIPTIKGNHEDLALAYSAHTARGFKAKCANEYDRDVWLSNGGASTLKSWGADFKTGLPDKVLQWMSGLPPYLLFDGLLLSHTGYCLDAHKENWWRTLWGRYPDDGDFVYEAGTGKPIDDGLYRVFGHTRVKEAVWGDNWVNIDSGCAYKGYGKLTGFLFPEKTTVEMENIDL